MWAVAALSSFRACRYRGRASDAQVATLPGVWLNFLVVPAS
jgi:hypothetical protein